MRGAEWPTRRRMILTCALLWSWASCVVSYTPYKTFNLEVDGERPLPVRMRVAQAVASRETLQRLREAVVTEFKDPARASGLKLDWRRFYLRDQKGAPSDAIFVVVQVPLAGDDDKASTILEYCVEILRSEVSKRLAEDVDEPPPRGSLSEIPRPGTMALAPSRR